MRILTIQQINLLDVPTDAVVVNQALRIIQQRDDESKTTNLTLFYTADIDGAIKIETVITEEDGKRVDLRDISNSVLAKLFTDRPQDMPDNLFANVITAINIANGKLAEIDQKNREARDKITYALISGQIIRSDIANMNWPVLMEHVDDMYATIRQFKGMLYALLTRETITNTEGEPINTDEWVKKVLDQQAENSSLQLDYSMYDGKVSPKELLMVRVVDQMIIQGEILKATQMIMLQNDVRNHYEPIIQKLQELLSAEEESGTEPDVDGTEEEAAGEEAVMPADMESAITSAAAELLNTAVGPTEASDDALDVTDVITQQATDLPEAEGEVVSAGDLQ